MKRIDFGSINWARLARFLLLLSLLIPVMPIVVGILGIAGQMILTILDRAMGAQLTRSAPWITWAIIGAFAGITPALWSLPGFRKRRHWVLLVPAVAMLVFCVLGLLAPTPAAAPTFVAGAAPAQRPNER